MASSIFKQQCPTCEAMVPIKDRTLVGKKIDCPKCKARFVVEDPDGGAEADDDKAKKKAKPDDKDKAPAKGKDKAKSKKKISDDYEEDEEGLGRPLRKKKPEGKSKMVIGVTLGVLVLGILGVAGYFMFGGEEKKPAVAAAGGGGGGGGSAPATAATADANPDPTQAKKEDAKAPPVVSELTNILPGDSEVVVNLASQDVLRSSLGKITADLASIAEQKEGWEKEAGLSADNMERVLLAVSASKQWFFAALRTNKPLKFDVVRKELNLQPAGEPIRGQDYFTFKAFDILKKAPGIPPQQLAMLTMMGVGQKPMALRLHDDQTLIIADLDPLKRFLEGGGKVEEKPKEAAAGEAAANAMSGGIGTTPMMRMGDSAGRSPGNPGGAKPAPVVASNAYQTLNPRLKSMLDKMEAKPFLISLAVDLDSMKLPGGTSPAAMLAANPMTAQMKIATVGFAIQAEGGVGAIAGVECKDANTTTLLEQFSVMGMMQAIPLVKEYVNLTVDWDRPTNNVAGAFGGEGSGGVGGMNMGTAASGMQMPMARPGMGAGMNPGMGAGMNPGMRMGMGQFGNPDAPGGAANLQGQLPTPTDEKTNGKLTVTGPTLNEQTLLLTVKIDSDGLNYLYEEYVLEGLLLAKGAAEMLMKHPQPHDLAQAVKMLADRTQAYPRGAYDRPQPAGRNLRPWLPDQRVSWMADALPYLGYAELHGQIMFDKSWRDHENKRPAMTIVPYFLNPTSKNETWHIHASGLNKKVAASHYVGVAGIGLDAADYQEKDAATAKKRGMFGYDRRTPITELADGASHTIMILQIPPETRGPWLSGGGSTVRGVPETKSVQPFVSTQHEGKKGTMALMADGSVRFVPEDINDKVFQNLCVVDKDKSPAGIDETILVPRQAGPVLKTQPALPAVTATTPAAPPAATATPTETPAAAANVEWKEFTGKTDQFSVLMPGAVKEDKKSVATLLGNVENRSYEAGAKGLRCVVTATQIMIPPGQDELFYSNFVQQRITGQNGTVQSEKKVNVGSIAAREYDVQLGGTAARIRAFLANGRAYSLMITTAGTSAEDIDKFFNSFKLLN